MNTVAHAPTAYRQPFDGGNRHGIVEEHADGREGRRKQGSGKKQLGGKQQSLLTRTVPAEFSNVAIDALRWWAARTPHAASSTSIPWKKVHRCVEAIFGAGAVAYTSLIGRITILGSTILRRRGNAVCNRLFVSLSPLEKVDVFGGPCAVAPLLDGVDVNTFFHEVFFGEVADDSDDRVAFTAWESPPGSPRGDADVHADVEVVAAVDPRNESVLGPPVEPNLGAVESLPPPSSPPSSPLAHGPSSSRRGARAHQHAATPRSTAPRVARPRTAPPLMEAAVPLFEEPVRRAFDDLVSEERAALRAGDLNAALAAQIERCGLDTKRFGPTRRATTPMDVARRGTAILHMNLGATLSPPTTALFLAKDDAAAILALCETQLVTWCADSPEQVEAAVSVFERATSTLALLRGSTSAFRFETIPGWTVQVARMKISEYCRRGHIDTLVKACTAVTSELVRAKPLTRGGGASEQEREVRRARAAAARMHLPGGISNAMQLLEREGAAPGNAETLTKLKALCPPSRGAISADTNAALDDFSRDPDGLVFFDVAIVDACIRKAARGKSQDLTGFRVEHLQSLFRNGGVVRGVNQFCAILTFLLESLARSPRSSFGVISRAQLVGVPKPKDPSSIRPIGITSVIRRIWAKVALASAVGLVEFFTNSHPRATQLAVGVQGGTQQLGILAQLVRDANPHYGTLQMDVTNAFNCIDREKMLRVLLALKSRPFAPHLLSFATSLYANGAQSLTFLADSGQQHTVSCESGVTQGCGLGTTLFAIGFHQIILDVLVEDEVSGRNEFKNVFVGAYADDIAAHGPPDELVLFANALASRLESDATLRVKEFTYFPGSHSPTISFTSREIVDSLRGWNEVSDGIVIAGNPIGSRAFIANFAARTLTKHDARLEAIRRFAETSSRDAVGGPHQGYYRHLALFLLDYCAKRRLDFLLHVTPTSLVNGCVLSCAQEAIDATFTKIVNGEVVFTELDDVGRALYALPHRFGGQDFPSLVDVAPLAFVGNIAAHAAAVVKKLRVRFPDLLDDIELASERQDSLREEGSVDILHQPSFFSEFSAVFHDVKEILESIDGVSLLPPTPRDTLTQTRPKLKREIETRRSSLRHEELMATLTRGVTHGVDHYAKSTAAIQLKVAECVRASRLKYRSLEALQTSNLNVKRIESLDTDLFGPGRPVNLISDNALPVITRMHLLQPVLSGPDAADFNFSEQHGFECLWNGDREMCNGTTKKSMHDGIVRATCDVFERLHGGRRVVHERDDLMRHMEYTDAHGVRHRPDLAINDYCSSGLKRVYDVTLVAPIGRITVAEKVTIVARVDHHGDAERAKRAKPAWSNYAAQDRSRATFVPLTLDWFGSLGPEFVRTCKELATAQALRTLPFGSSIEALSAEQLNIFDRTRDWHFKRTLSFISTYALNAIGRYVYSVRESQEVIGPLTRARRDPALPRRDLKRPDSCVFKSVQCDADGEPVLAAIRRKGQTLALRERQHATRYLDYGARSRLDPRAAVYARAEHLVTGADALDSVDDAYVVDDVVDDVGGVIGVGIVGVVGVTSAANSDDDIARVDVAAAALAQETR